MAITKEEIYAVADALKQEGAKPTLAAVRRRLGSGSFTTISEAICEWKLMQHSTSDNDKLMPDNIKERLYLLGAAMWTEAMHIATSRFSQERETMEEKFKEKEDYYSQLEQLSAEYDTELESAKACIGELREKLATTEKECVVLQQSLDKSEHARNTTEKRNMELKEELTRAHKATDKLQKNLTDLIANFETMQNQKEVITNV